MISINNQEGSNPPKEDKVKKTPPKDSLYPEENNDLDI